MNTRHCSVLLILFAVTTLGIAPAQADPIPYPDEWIGVWEITSIARDCDTQAILFQNTVLDTICAGEIYEPDPEDPLTCSGTITQNTVSIQCEGSYEEEPGCTANVQLTIDGTRNGNAWSSTTRIETTFVGSTCPISEFCIVTTQNAARIDLDPDCPAAPVEPITWGSLKHMYD